MASTALRLALVFVAAMLPLKAGAAPLCSLKPAGNPSTIAKGIVYQAYTVACPESSEGGPEVKAKTGNMHLVRVDLAVPGLSVLTSVPTAAAKSSIPGTGGIFTVAPTSAVFPRPASKMVGSVPMPVPQIAINANLFTNCCTTDPSPPPNRAETRLRGLEIAGGKVAVLPLANQAIGGFVPYGSFATSLTINQSGQASIWTAATSTSVVPPGTVTAVTGSHHIVSGGKGIVRACSGAYPCSEGVWLGPNARTGVGLNGPSSLVLVVADGVDNEEGLTLYQFADVVAQVAETAINLDGGGSSTMVRRSTSASGFSILNNLPGGQQRDVGAILYVATP